MISVYQKTYYKKFNIILLLLCIIAISFRIFLIFKNIFDSALILESTISLIIVLWALFDTILNFAKPFIIINHEGINIREYLFKIYSFNKNDIDYFEVLDKKSIILHLKNQRRIPHINIKKLRKDNLDEFIKDVKEFLPQIEFKRA